MNGNEKLDQIHECVKKNYYALYGLNGTPGLMKRVEKIEAFVDNYGPWVKAAKWLVMALVAALIVTVIGGLIVL